MRRIAIITFALLVIPNLSAFSANAPAKRSYSTHDYYVLEHDPTLSLSPQECADALGVEVVEQVGELDNHWLVRAPNDAPSKRSLDGDLILQRLAALKRAGKLQPRSPLGIRQLARSIRSLEPQIPRLRTKKRAPTPFPEPAPPPVTPTKADRIAIELGIADPIFHDQWHFANPDHPAYDLNVSGLWAQGVTGKGVYTAVVDDGLDSTSDDLAANFNLEGSWDFNDHTNLPMPRLSDDQHGTRCCGEIAAVKNDVCGVGVAYEAKIAGIRILSGPISDADEAASLNYGYNQTSIYSCSWGPPDDGKSMDAPSHLIQKAVVNGIQKGRNGKGSIFVFASGNGAGSGDQCNFDGYTNSIYSVTVAAVDHEGKHPYYSEACAANMIVAYSSGGGKRIYTTDVGKNKCTGGHGGTSAAAPLAAGVFALALQVRPELTWRDIQHLCIRASLHINPDDPDWEMTSVGRPYSYKYGYGALDAWTYVELARTWKLVKPQAWVDLPQVEIDGANITPDGNMSGGTFIGANGVDSKITVTSGVLKENNFETLEHITVKVWISHTRRGDVEVQIISPKGVTSVLAAVRQFDGDNSGYPGWQFMSVKHWGEDPTGDWTLHVKDQGVQDRNGSFLGWSLYLWGECIDPSKAKLWTFPPGSEEEEATDDPSSTVSSGPTTDAPTKTHPKPTDQLPDNHHTAVGEATKPAFDDAKPPAATPQAPDSPAPSPSITPDEGYFSHMSDLLSSQTWLFGAIGAVTLFAIIAGIFFWRRSVRRRTADYSAVGTEDHAMGTMDGGMSRLLGKRSRPREGEGRTKELYDAFGEPNDDDDSAGEEDELVRGHSGPVSPGLRYHDGFLDDDLLDSASPIGRSFVSEGKRDADSRGSRREDAGSSSPSGSGTGSWEHASADVPR